MPRPPSRAPSDITKDGWVRGAAMSPDGLDPVAQDRAASMADEGGRSAAEVERQPPTGRTGRIKRLALVLGITASSVCLIIVVSRALYYARR